MFSPAVKRGWRWPITFQSLARSRSTSSFSPSPDAKWSNAFPASGTPTMFGGAPFQWKVIAAVRCGEYSSYGSQIGEPVA